MKHRLFFLPIETKNREFIGKLLTATMAAQENWLVFLGQAKMVRKNMANFLPGVYSEISIPEYKYKAHLLDIARKGHKIVNICEESVTYPDGRDYCDRKVGANSLSLVDLFFASGERHARDVMSFRNISAERIPVTGSHRMDVLRSGFRDAYSTQSNAIKKALGPFILVNTNFARCNPHPNYGNRLAGLQEKKVISSNDQIQIWRESRDYKAQLMTEFMSLIPDIISKFDCQVVIRPHPSENHETWNAWAQVNKNVHIRHEGNANEWMLAAEATIHNGCTTGLEAFMLERPVVAYVPDPESDYSKNIANEVSHQVHTKEELFNALEKALYKGRMDSEEERSSKAGKLKYYIENVDGSFAWERIVEELNTLDVPYYSLEEILKKASLKSFSGTFTFSACREFCKKGLNLFRKKRDAKYSKVLQKFPGLSENELMEPLHIWEKQGLLPSLPRIVKVSDNLFCLYCENQSA